MLRSCLKTGAPIAAGARIVSPALRSRFVRRVGLPLASLAVIGVLLTGCAGTSSAPTAAPTAAPIAAPTAAPTAVTQPTKAPVLTAAEPTKATAPTQASTMAPTTVPATATTAAPAATSAPTAQPTAAAKTVSFAKDVLPIFQQSCIKCHGGDSTEGGLVLKTQADVLKGSKDGDVIKPGDSKNSLLVQQINSGKMPKRAAKLSQEFIDTIAAWVDAGAPNN